MKSRITPERVLAFAKDVKKLTEVTDKFSMRKLTEQHEISSMIPHAMIKGRIIENRGGTAQTASYHWICSVDPNLKMAERIIKEYVDEYERQRRKALKKQNKNQLSIKVEKEQIESRSTQEINDLHEQINIMKSKVNLLNQSKPKTKKLSILWGLYSVEK